MFIQYSCIVRCFSSSYSWKETIASQGAGQNISWHYLHDSSKMSSDWINLMFLLLVRKEGELGMYLKNCRYAFSILLGVNLFFSRWTLLRLNFIIRILSRTDSVISTTCLSANKSGFGSAHIFVVSHSFYSLCILYWWLLCCLIGEQQLQRVGRLHTSFFLIFVVRWSKLIFYV